jgi:hypothetical protein
MVRRLKKIQSSKFIWGKTKQKMVCTPTPERYLAEKPGLSGITFYQVRLYPINSMTVQW